MIILLYSHWNRNRCESATASNQPWPTVTVSSGSKLILSTSRLCPCRVVTLSCKHHPKGAVLFCLLQVSLGKHIKHILNNYMHWQKNLHQYISVSKMSCSLLLYLSLAMDAMASTKISSKNHPRSLSSPRGPPSSKFGHWRYGSPFPGSPLANVLRS